MVVNQDIPWLTTKDRFVSHFDPYLRPITEKMGANELATFLSNLTLPNSEFEISNRRFTNWFDNPARKLKL
jgi:hypothetical protein